MTNEHFVANMLRWRADAAQWAYEVLGFVADPWQRQALDAWSDPRQQRISLQACAGPGKTAVIAIMAWHFLSCWGSLHEHPKGAATSITEINLRDNLWAELRKWQTRSDYLESKFKWTATRVFAVDHPETWFLSARSWPKSANPDEQGKTLSGLHSKYVAMFVDESGAIPTTILRAADQALANTVFGKVVQAGNPISLEGMLYAAATQLRHLWTIIRITGDPDDPNAWVNGARVIAEAVPGSKTPAEMNREQIETYGIDNPWVMSYILGKFPPASINALLGVEEVEASMKRHLDLSEYAWVQKRLGVDVARFGDDRSVIFPRQGLAAFNPVIMRNARTTDIAARVVMAIAKWGAEVTLVDDTGHWGHGVIDNLSTMGKPSIGLNYAGKAINPRYKNRRAEMWFRMAEWVKGGGALPAKYPQLVAELTTPTYTMAGGQIILEEKDQIKLRLGRSPDLADALANTFAIPDMPSGLQSQLQGHLNTANQTTHDWDPFKATM